MQVGSKFKTENSETVYIVSKCYLADYLGLWIEGISVCGKFTIGKRATACVSV